MERSSAGSPTWRRSIRADRDCAVALVDRRQSEPDERRESESVPPPATAFTAPPGVRREKRAAWDNSGKATLTYCGSPNRGVRCAHDPGKASDVVCQCRLS